jgi:hypothetical protein
MGDHPRRLSSQTTFQNPAKASEGGLTYGSTVDFRRPGRETRGRTTGACYSVNEKLFQSIAAHVVALCARTVRVGGLGWARMKTRVPYRATIPGGFAIIELSKGR